MPGRQGGVTGPGHLACKWQDRTGTLSPFSPAKICVPPPGGRREPSEPWTEACGEGGGTRILGRRGPARWPPSRPIRRALGTTVLSHRRRHGPGRQQGFSGSTSRMARCPKRAAGTCVLVLNASSSCSAPVCTPPAPRSGAQAAPEVGARLPAAPPGAWAAVLPPSPSLRSKLRFPSTPPSPLLPAARPPWAHLPSPVASAISLTYSLPLGSLARVLNQPGSSTDPSGGLAFYMLFLPEGPSGPFSLFSVPAAGTSPRTTSPSPEKCS